MTHLDTFRDALRFTREALGGHVPDWQTAIVSLEFDNDTIYSLRITTPRTAKGPTEHESSIGVAKDLDTISRRLKR